MDDFVGWTEIIGNLYTGEVFRDFGSCAEQVLADMKVTGTNLLFVSPKESDGGFRGDRRS
jgi:hypothetical protein